MYVPPVLLIFILCESKFEESFRITNALKITLLDGVWSTVSLIFNVKSPLPKFRIATLMAGLVESCVSSIVTNSPEIPEGTGNSLFGFPDRSCTPPGKICKNAAVPSPPGVFDSLIAPTLCTSVRVIFIKSKFFFVKSMAPCIY